MSRHKKFPAIVGDIDTVDFKNFVPAGNDDVRVHLVNIHKYFVKNKRVGNYEEIQSAVKDAADGPGPSGSNDSKADARAEEMARLRTQIEAAHARLKELEASEPRPGIRRHSQAPSPSPVRRRALTRSR